MKKTWHIDPFHNSLTSKNAAPKRSSAVSATPELQSAVAVSGASHGDGYWAKQGLLGGSNMFQLSLIIPNSSQYTKQIIM